MADDDTKGNGGIVAAASSSHDLKTILAGGERDFLIRNNGNQVKISELDGKIVGLYFSRSRSGPCRRFNSTLVKAHKGLSVKGNFEVIFISSDRDEESFTQYFSKMPWLAIPFSDSSTIKSVRQLLKLRGIPHLVILGPKGNVLSEEGVKIVGDHGLEAYPFLPERMKELEEQEKAAKENQTLTSLLASTSRDFVISSDGTKVSVADLVCKNILFYFSAHWCGPCRAFLPSLIKAYEEIKATDKAFELIFVSSDRDESTFQDYFSGMPWLALPFEDERCEFLSCKFKILGIPSLVAIGPTGRTVTTEARDLIAVHGSKAYPFTEEHIAAMEARMEEMDKGWPEKVRSASHAEHEQVLTRKSRYICNGCNMERRRRSYYCKECDFDLHPKCYFKEIEVKKKDEGEKEEASKDGRVCDGEKDEGKEEEASKDGWVCDGELCHKVE